MHDGLALIRSGELLYQDDVGRDACGIGGVAAKDGKPSHEVVKKAVLALKNLEHRGGICGDSGDGAGLTCQIPQAFFKEEAKRLKFDQARFLKPEDRLAIGVFFFLDAGPRIDDAKRIIASIMSGGPVHVFGWRPVPVNQAALPERSRESQPGAIEQLLMRAEASSEEVERWLYRRRLELRHRFVEAGLSVYIPSLSNWLVSYKGLLTSFQFADFYPDLSRPEFESGIAIFHRRYSTNTYPNWSLAQPFRYGCHNGEINTVRTNRNAVHAYSRGLKPTLPGNGDLLSPKQSDSGSLDEWVEHLILERNWSLLRAMRLTVPPVWDSEEDYWGHDAVDMFTHCRRAYGSLCAWDGPAGLIATDGQTLIGQVDRMGLRPVRWCSDKRGWLYIGSESGVYGLETSTIVASGQLQPGQMIALDTATGERLDHHQIMAKVVKEVRQTEVLPRGFAAMHDLNRSEIIIPEGFDFTAQTEDAVGAMLADRNWSLDHLLQASGWDFERAGFVKDMAKLRKEPLSSMGHDRVLTIFSAHHPTLFKYLQQTFAEVTNPPIDPYREGGAMSLVTYLGKPSGFAVVSREPVASAVSREPLASAEEQLPIRQMEPFFARRQRYGDRRNSP